MIMSYYSDPDEYGGTGFLTDDFIFVTAAHNVRDPNNANMVAAKVTLRFGLDGDANHTAVKAIQLKGEDFTVPSSYRRPTDWCDVAWLDMKKYVDDQLAQGVALNWGISDLPTRCFYKCTIPDEHGAIGEFSLCGNHIYIIEM